MRLISIFNEAQRCISLTNLRRADVSQHAGIAPILAFPRRRGKERAGEEFTF
jgi:hypothetical protein